MSPREFLERRAWQLMAAATTAVVVLSALRGIARGYQPIGDNALVELRARDVLTSDHPFIGMWSSASISSGLDVNHPGPLLFDAIALPLRLFGGAAGVALGVMVLHVAAVWTVGWVAHRVGGQTTAVATMTVTALLVWTLGSELLYDPWLPNVLVLPFWLFLCTVWAIVAGETALFPLAVGVGSFAMQTHLGHVFIVPVLLTTAAVIVVRRSSAWADLRRPTLQSLGVIAVLWAQPLWEQFFGPGRGNLGRVLTAGTGGADDFETVAHTRTGLVLGVRILGSVLALPPWWGRPGYEGSIPDTEQTITDDGLSIDATGLRTFVPAAAGLVLLAAVVGTAWWATRRAGARRIAAGFTVLAAAFVTAAVTIVITPIDIIGLSGHKVRWLWVIGAFATLMVLLAILALLQERDPDWRRRAVGGLAALGAVALIATVPTYANPSGPVQFAITYPAIESLREQVADHVDAMADSQPLDRVLFDPNGIGFAEPYTSAIMAELVEQGVDLVVDDTSLARQLGPDRRADRTDPTEGGRTPVVFVRVGQEAVDIPEGALRIAFHDGERTPFSVDVVTDRAVAVFVDTRVPEAALS